MVEVQVHHLKPTRLIPNSPQPLLYYPSLFKPIPTTSTLSPSPSSSSASASASSPPSSSSSLDPSKIHQLLDTNSWKTQWIFRYGPTQDSHYHSRIHECMVVLSGHATIRFGAGDTSPDLASNTHGTFHEAGGITIAASVGDVFVIPAGVAHKTYNTSPSAPFALLTPGHAHGVDTEAMADALPKIQLSGFTMMGAYPKNCGTWDFAVQGKQSDFKSSWTVPKPENDPVLGSAVEGVRGQWKEINPDVDVEVKGEKLAKL